MQTIEVENLTKDYGFGRGVFDVSISVKPNEVFGFLGPNGAGKSTTIRHLMGFSKPDGGLSIFALVAAMLGLFGSQVIPQVVRLDSLNYFNYVTIISLFDVVSVLEGTTAFVPKFAILFALGAAGYAADAVRFCKKDLPL